MDDHMVFDWEFDECGCMNGGSCIDIEQSICECPIGFEGDRCEDVYIDFVKSGFGKNAQIATIISVVLFVFIATSVFCFLTWRRCKMIRRRHREVHAHVNRRQSKATIEGSSVPGWEADVLTEKYNSALAPMINLNEKSAVNTLLYKNGDINVKVHFTIRTEV